MTKSKPRLSCDHLKFIKSKLRLSCDHLEGFRMTKSKPRLSCDQAATELRPLVGAATELRPFDNMKISESKPRPSCDHLRFTESKPRRSCDRFALELRPFGRRDVAATSRRPFFFTWVSSFTISSYVVFGHPRVVVLHPVVSIKLRPSLTRGHP